MWLLEFLFVGLAVAATPRTVVTFDNGGFNAAFYAPRYSGFAKPSAAQEIASAIGRAAGSNPEVWTYLPPGRAEARPGDAYLVEPRPEGCAGPAEAPGDACWCSPGDRCWSELGTHRHPAGSTSLYLTATKVREAGTGPRIEVHFTDVFEEDPSTAENPADSDRCVTRSGARKALDGLMAVGDGRQVDHLAVGVLRAVIDPPPPGRDAGSTFQFEMVDGDCWSGRSTGRWTSGRAPIDFAMGVVVLGIDTEDAHEEVARFLDGFESQLSSATMSLDLVRTREPAQVEEVKAVVSGEELGRWSRAGPERSSTVDCARVLAQATASLDGLPVDVMASGGCDGSFVLNFDTRALRSAWYGVHGVNPFAPDGVMEGQVNLKAAVGATRNALEALATANEAVEDRPLPLWGVVDEVASVHLRPMDRRAYFRLRVTNLDQRRWGIGLIGFVVLALVGARATHNTVVRSQAKRAYRAAWDRAMSTSDDPMRQPPVAVILADAHDEMHRRALARTVLALCCGITIGAFWLVCVLRVTSG